MIEDTERMREYEKRTGQKVIYSFQERVEIYKGYDTETLKRTEGGIQNAISARLNPENEFDSLDDGWKLKMLEDNLRAIRQTLEERLKS